jgi:hypothetical protein
MHFPFLDNIHFSSHHGDLYLASSEMMMTGDEGGEDNGDIDYLRSIVVTSIICAGL